MRVEITFTNGSQISFYAEKFEIKRTPITGMVDGASWTDRRRPGVPVLHFVRLEKVLAVVTYPEVGDVLPNGYVVQALPESDTTEEKS